MIEEKVKIIADHFAQSWSSFFAAYPYYQLDYSWPSVGVLDYILRPLRGKKELTDQERIVVEASAAYLACICHDSWKSFPDKPRISVSLIEEPSIEIVLRATGGQYLESDLYYVVPLVKVMISLLRDAPDPLPTFAKSTSMLTAENNLISLFATGLLSGLSPHGSGAWKDIPPDKFTTQIYAAARFASETSAGYYERIFPLEEIGSHAEFFFSYLILPPPGFEEIFPSSRAAAGVLHFLRSIDATEEQISKLAENLVRMPHELIASVGFILGAAFARHPAPAPFRAFSEVRPLYSCALVPAVQALRALKGEETHWIDEMKAGNIEKAEEGAALDYELGLLPLLYFDSLQDLADENLAVFFRSLTWSSAAAARDLLELYRLPRQIPVALHFQHVFLDLFLSDAAAAEEKLAMLGEDECKHDSRLLFRFFELQALLHEKQGKEEEARAFLERAYACGTPDLQRLARVSELLAQLYAKAGEAEKGAAVLSHAIQQYPRDLSLRLSFCIIGHFLNSEEAVDTELAEALRIAPNSPQVFNLVKDIILARQLEAHKIAEAAKARVTVAKEERARAELKPQSAKPDTMDDDEDEQGGLDKALEEQKEIRKETKKTTKPPEKRSPERK